MDECKLTWAFGNNSVHGDHPKHLGEAASYGSTSFVGLLARRIGLVKATGGMIYNALANENDTVRGECPCLCSKLHTLQALLRCSADNHCIRLSGIFTVIIFVSDYSFCP